MTDSQRRVVYTNPNAKKDNVSPLDKNTKDAERFLENGEFDEVIKSSNRALELGPKRIKPYIFKSIALQRKGKSEDALKCSESAIALADKNKDTEQLAAGHLRRGITLFHLNRIEDSQASINWAEEAGSKDKSLAVWKAKIDKKLQEKSDREEVKISRIPIDALPEEKPATKSSLPPAQKKQPITQTGSSGKKVVEVDDSSEDEDVKAALKEKEQYKQQVNAQAQKSKNLDIDPNNIRKDWFQSSNSVDISLFIKNVPKESAKVDFTAKEAILSFKQPTSGEPFKYTLGPFPYPIDSDSSSFKVFGTKVELSLKKAGPEKWSELTSSGGAATNTTSNESDSTVSLDSMRKALNEPKLPSMNGNKNWDKLAESQLAEDGGEDDENPNAFFEKLYENADEDTRRAMMKSFVESNGTSLSTDWSEVSKQKVETVPPEGMEPKSWKS